MFAQDRDLLALDPNVFRDVAWSGQTLVTGTGSVSGEVLTLSAQDNTFEAAGVDQGNVVLVGASAYEVVERTNSTAVRVSRVRASIDDDVIPPSPATDGQVSVVSFAAQVALVHAQVLRMAGIEPEDAGLVEAPGEGDITNPGALTMIEALGALHLVYASAAALSAEGSGAWTRAAFFRERFAAARQTAAVRLDLDGDGVPDATRRLNVVQFIRG